MAGEAELVQSGLRVYVRVAFLKGGLPPKSVFRELYDWVVGSFFKKQESLLPYPGYLNADGFI